MEMMYVQKEATQMEQWTTVELRMTSSECLSAEERTQPYTDEHRVNSEN